MTAPALQDPRPQAPEASGLHYDVFLCHNRAEKPLVKDLAEALQLERGILFFLDEYAIPPSVEFLAFIADAIRLSASCAIFLGPAGWGPTHRKEAVLAIERHGVEPNFRIIPVLLPGGDERLWGELFGAGGSPFNWVRLTSLEDTGGRGSIADAVQARLEPRAAGPETVTPYYIRRQAALWEASGRIDASLLFRGGLLTAAQRVAVADPVFVSANASAFLAESAQAERQAKELELAQARTLAEEQRQRAEATEQLLLSALAQALASQAIGLAEGGPVPDDLAALLALQASRFDRRSGQSAANLVDRALRSALGLAHFMAPLPPPARQGTALAFDPSGRWLAVGAADGTVAIWDLAQCDVVHALLRRSPQQPAAVLAVRGHPYWLAFGPDGTSLVAIAGYGGESGLTALQDDYPVVLWQEWRGRAPPLAIGRAALLANNRRYPSTPPFAAGSSLDGSLFTFVGPGGFEIWRFGAAGSGAARVLEGAVGSDVCRAVAVTGDNLSLVLVGATGIVTAIPIDPPAGPARRSELRDWLPATSWRGVELVPLTAISADGRTVAQLPYVPSSLYPVGTWRLGGEDPAPRRVPRRSRAPYGGGSISSFAADFVRAGGTLQFDPEARWLALADAGAIRLWPAEWVDEPPALLPGPGVACLAFSRDGRVLAAAGEATRLWALQPSERASTVVGRHEATVRTVVFVSAGRRLLSFGADDRIRRWDLEQIDDEPAVLDLAEGGMRLALRSLELRDDSGAVDTTMLRLPVCEGGGKVVFPVVRQDAEAAARDAFAWLDPDAMVAAVTQTVPPVTISLGRGETRQMPVLAAAMQGEGGPLWSVEYDIDTFINASDAKGAIRVGWVRGWEQPDAPVVRGELRGAEPVMVLFGGRKLAAATNDRAREAVTTVQVWDLADPQAEPQVVGRVQGLCSVIACGNDSMLALAVGADIALIDLEQPETDPFLLRGHRDRVTALAFNPDASVLATGSEDQTIRLWHLARRRASPVILDARAGEVTALAFNPDGTLLASGGADGTVRLWIATAELLAECLQTKVRRPLSEAEWDQYVGPAIPFDEPR